MKKTISRVGLMTLGLLLPLISKAVSVELGTLQSTGLGTKNLTETVAAIIQIIIGFLGVIAIIITLIGGLKWMTAAGNEEKVAEAKKLLGAGVIGLIIILAAYAITTFIINSLSTAVGG